MAPSLTAEFKCFSFLTPPSFLTCKVRKKIMERCIWVREDYQHLPACSSRPRIGEESSEPMKFQEWLVPGNDLRLSQHFFPSARIFVLKMRLENELHTVHTATVITLTVPSTLTSMREGIHLNYQLLYCYCSEASITRCNSPKSYLCLSRLVPDAVIKMVKIPMPRNPVGDTDVHLCCETIFF